MKKLLSKSKALVSIVSAFAILAVSLFSVLSGVSFKTIAAGGSISEYTGEELEVSLLDPTQPNSKSNPYIIENANQMYGLMIGKSTNGGETIDTDGKYFKVADGMKKFYMNGGATVAAMTSPEQVKTWFESNSYKKVWSSVDRTFKGTFDGNGVTIYGIGGDGANAGLFPFVDKDVVIKNVTVKNSYLKSITAGGLVGTVNGSKAPNSITAENCQVIGNYIAGGRNDCGGGGLFGFLYSNKATDGYPVLTVNNCIVYGNEIIATHPSAPGGFALAGSLNGNRPHKITNSILLGGDCIFNVGSWWAKQPSNYVNVFTDADLSATGQTYSKGSLESVTVDSLKGSAGYQKLAEFDFANVWFASEGNLPTLRVFHDIKGTPVNVDGHNNEVDECCSTNSLYTGISSHVYVGDSCKICGYTYPCANGHNFTDIPAVETSTEAAGNIAHKYCDQCQKKYADDAAIDAPLSAALSEDEIIIPQILPYDTWNGTWDDYFWMNNEGDGSPANPFIIETAEQLASVVTTRLKYDASKPTSENFDVSKYAISSNTLDTSGVFFKVKTGITAFYMNGSGTATGEFKNADEVKAYFESNPGQTWWTAGTFKGNFNGNGVVVYGLYATKESAGLFPKVGPDVVIKNITVANSYVKSEVAGGLFGQVEWYNGINNNATATIRNCAVVNCYIESTSATVDAGVAGGHIREHKLKLNNFLAYNNKVVSVSGNVGGLLGKGWGSADEVYNSVFIGTAPYSPGADKSRAKGANYKNVYTDQDLAAGEALVQIDQKDFKYIDSQIKKLDSAKMVGLQAQTNMPALDWVAMWKANENGCPTPRLLSVKDYAPGYVWSGDVAEEFPAGEGTKTNPYKISTPEYLALMLNIESDGLFFELTEDIVINDVLDENAKQWLTSENTKVFKGTLEGNGHTVSGIYYNDANVSGAIGLIPVKGSGSVLNVKVDNSYINVPAGVFGGAVIGRVEDGEEKPIYLHGVTVEDSVVIEGEGIGAGLVAKCGNSVLRINNCISKAKVETLTTATGIVAITGGGISVKNTVSAGVAPFGSNDKVVATNVYTDAQNVAELDGVIVLATEDLKGENAKTNTKLAFDEIWSVVADSYPAITGIINTANGTMGDVWTGEIALSYASGTGTKDDPYIITTGEMLARCVTSDNTNKYYKLAADIYLNDVNSPLWADKIGCTEWFNSRTGATWKGLTNGTFDGDGYVIYGMYYNRQHYTENSAFHGLFATVGENAQIKNVGISDAYLACSKYAGDNFNEFCGAFIGYVVDWDEIDLDAHDGYSTKAITSDPAYYVRMPVISNCFVDSKSYLSGRCVGGYVGGAAGTFRIENSIFTGSLEGKDKTTTGGMVGQDMCNGAHYIDCISFPQTCDRPLGGASNADWRTTPQYFITTVTDVYYFSMYRVYNNVTKISKPEQRVGEAAKVAMPNLDWAGTDEDGTEDLWRVVENGTPMPTIFDKHRDDADKFSDRAFAAPEVTVNLITGATDVQLETTELVGRMYSKMELPTPTRVGYKFTGWYPHANLSVEYPYDYFPPRNLNLYAGWEPIGVICNFESYTDTIWDYDDTRWIFNKPGAKGGYKNAYVRNGSKSMHLLDNSAESADVLLNYDPMLEIGETYEMTFWVTTDKANNPATKLSLVHNSKPVYLDTGIAIEDMVVVEKLTVGEWTQYKYVFTAQTNWISIRATGNSSLYFDDIIIAPTSSIAAAENLVLLDADAYVVNAGVSPRTNDNIALVSILVALIVACAIITVVSRKNLEEIVED